MDDLLALMNASDAVEYNIDNNHRQHGTEPVKSSQVQSYQCRSAPLSTPAISPGSANTILHIHLPKPFHNPTETAVDEKVGIRMTQRMVSSLEMLDLISENPYFSTAALSAMSRARLNELLVVPSAIVSAENVAGRTNILTLGIVFENSGTRISSKGGAYSLLKIGNLVTGPCCTIFLFGDAYGNFTTKLRPGMVVALLSPNLIPPKPNSNDTAVALSVRDTKQIVHVAKAQDFGICKGISRSHKSTNKPCKQFVDTRICSYCNAHRAQLNVANGVVNVNQEKSFLQKMRHEGVRPIQKCPTGTKSMKLASGVVVSFAHGTTLSKNSIMNPPIMTDRLSVHIPTITPNSTPLLNQAPKHMKKGESIISRKISSGLVNSYQKGFLPKAKLLAANRCDVNQSTVAIDWLKPAVASNHTKRRVVNTVGTIGFNGTVIIPKPNKLFRSTMARVERQPDLGASKEIKSVMVVDKQRQLAALLKMAKPISKDSETRSRYHSNSTVDNEFRVSFDKFSKVDTDSILAIKSRFAKEADAEAYAKSRLVVSDLERREIFKEQNEAKRKKAGISGTKIEKEWICVTCNKRRSQMKPNICIRQNHKVRLERLVKSVLSEADKRSKLNETDVDDGGLTLGQGLDWSGFCQVAEE